MTYTHKHIHVVTFTVAGMSSQWAQSLIMFLNEVLNKQGKRQRWLFVTESPHISARYAKHRHKKWQQRHVLWGSLCLTFAQSGGRKKRRSEGNRRRGTCEKALFVCCQSWFVSWVSSEHKGTFVCELYERVYACVTLDSYITIRCSAGDTVKMNPLMRF